MEQHPVPRQITTFEFKLIGFMTLKQFIYLIIFIPLAYIIFSVFPIPILNFLLAAIVAGFGIALAFLPINDRPLDVYIKNFLKRLSSPTQYYYQKGNKPLDFSNQNQSPEEAQKFIDSKKKLANYLLQNKKREETTRIKPENADESNQKVVVEPTPEQETIKNVTPIRVVEVTQPEVKETITTEQETIDEKKPYLVGEVKNPKQTPLPGILVYIKDNGGKPLRLLKTNPHGVFATFNRLPQGEYTFEAKDPKGLFFFDKMRLNLEENPKPSEIYSKDIL